MRASEVAELIMQDNEISVEQLMENASCNLTSVISCIVSMRLANIDEDSSIQQRALLN